MPSPESLSGNPSKQHYSEKGGHFLRGRAARQRRNFELRFPHTSYPGSHPDTEFTTRRFMMRNPSSGKRRGV